MPKLGFSTGSIAKSNYKLALKILENVNGIECIELSALREEELEGLINSLDSLNLSKYSYVSFHAPSKINYLNEIDLIKYLEKVLDKNYNIIVHPDIIVDFNNWKDFGKNLCIENMDKRKSIGRTFLELSIIFEKLPNASLCFDIAHAYQVDSSMIDSIDILNSFREKIMQIHVSEVNSESRHETLSLESVLAYKNVSPFISKDIPIIIESILNENEISHEILLNEFIFSDNISSRKFNKLNSIFHFQK